MTSVVSHRPPGARPVHVPSRATDAFDLLVAVGCTAFAVAVHRSGVDAVAANREVDLLSTLLTVLAVAPIAVRRRQPLPVMGCCTTSLLGLMAGDYAVAVAPVGLLIAFYTVAAWGTRHSARVALGVVMATLAATALLRPVDLSVQGIAVNCLLLAVGWVLGTGAWERRALHEAHVEAAARELEYERERAGRAAVDERLRISRELHDVLGHAISVMMVQAGVAQHLLGSRPDQAAEALARVTDTGRSSLEELRRLVSVIRDGGQQGATGELPGLAELSALAADMTAAGVAVRLRCEVDQEIPAGVALAAYRIVQEALTNTLRHAGPAQASVVVRCDGGELEIEVADNGRGNEGHEDARGRGLVGMSERVAVYGGDLSTGPGADRGYVVRARIPLPGGPADALADALPERPGRQRSGVS